MNDTLALQIPALKEHKEMVLRALRYHCNYSEFPSKDGKMIEPKVVILPDSVNRENCYLMAVWVDSKGEATNRTVYTLDFLKTNYSK